MQQQSQPPQSKNFKEFGKTKSLGDGAHHLKFQ
jgi:hypothetical protein